MHRNAQDSAETRTPFRKHKPTMEKMLRSVRLCVCRYEDNVLEWPEYFSMWVHSRRWKTYAEYKKCALYGHCWSEFFFHKTGLSVMPEFPLPHPSTSALPELPLPHPSTPVLSSTGHSLQNRKMLLLLLSVLVKIVLVGSWVDQT